MHPQVLPPNPIRAQKSGLVSVTVTCQVMTNVPHVAVTNWRHLTTMHAYAERLLAQCKADIALKALWHRRPFHTQLKYLVYVHAQK